MSLVGLETQVMAIQLISVQRNQEVGQPGNNRAPRGKFVWQVQVHGVPTYLASTFLRTAGTMVTRGNAALSQMSIFGYQGTALTLINEATRAALYPLEDMPRKRTDLLIYRNITNLAGALICVPKCDDRSQDIETRVVQVIIVAERYRATAENYRNGV